MKIISLKAMPFTYVADAEQASKYLRGQRLSCLFVRVETDGGVSGYGEVCDSFCCNYPLSVGAVIEEALEPLLAGEDAAAIESLVEKMRWSTRRRLGDQGVVIQAISGVEIALWDLLGKIKSMPVTSLLGGSRRQIPVYASGTFLEEGPPEWHARFYEPCLSRGINAIKVRMGLDYSRDLETLRGLRRLLGSDIQIMVDGNEYYTLSTALEISRALEEPGVLFFEEPIPQCRREAIASLVERSRVPIAYGEHLFTIHDFQDCLAHRRVDVVQPDAAICGGISEGMKIAALAETFGAGVLPHSAAGPISLAANLHFAAAASNVSMLEYSFPLEPLWREMLRGPMLSPAALRNGTLTVPDGPGLGLVIDEDIWGRHAYQGPSAMRIVQTQASGAV